MSARRSSSRLAANFKSSSSNAMKNPVDLDDDDFVTPPGGASAKNMKPKQKSLGDTEGSSVIVLNKTTQGDKEAGGSSVRVVDTKSKTIGDTEGSSIKIVNPIRQRIERNEDSSVRIVRPGRPKKERTEGNDNKTKKGKENEEPAKIDVEQKKEIPGRKRKAKTENPDVVKGKKQKQNTTTEGDDYEFQKLSSRMSPSSMHLAVQSLSDSQHMVITAMGFGAFLNLKMTSVATRLGYFLVQNYNIETSSIHLEHGEIKISKEAVHAMLGLPTRGIEFHKLKECSENNEKYLAWKKQWKKKEKFNNGNYLKKIRATDEADNNFKMNFLTLFINTFADMESSGSSKVSFIRKLVDVEDLREIDWCGYMIDCLEKAKKRWRPNDTNSYFTGPLELLLLLYADRAICEDVKIRRLRPFITELDAEHLRLLEEYEMESGRIGALELRNEAVDRNAAGYSEETVEDYNKILETGMNIVCNIKDKMEKSLLAGLVMYPEDETLLNWIDVTEALFSANHFKSLRKAFVKNRGKNSEPARVVEKNDGNDKPTDGDSGSTKNTTSEEAKKSGYKSTEKEVNEGIDMGSGGDKSTEKPSKEGGNMESGQKSTGKPNKDGAIMESDQKSTEKEVRNSRETETGGGKKNQVDSAYETPVNKIRTTEGRSNAYTPDDLTPTFIKECDEMTNEKLKKKLEFKSTNYVGNVIGNLDVGTLSASPAVGQPERINEKGKEKVVAKGVEDGKENVKLGKRIVKKGRMYCSPYVKKVCDLMEMPTTEEHLVAEAILGTTLDLSYKVWVNNDTGYSLTLEHAQTLVAPVNVDPKVVDIWAIFLTKTDGLKSPSSPGRIYFPTTVVEPGMFDEKEPINFRFANFCDRIQGAITNVTDGDDLHNFDLVFFPIVRDKDYYLIIFNLKRCAFHIIDSKKTNATVESLYGAVPRVLQSFFCDYLAKTNHKKTNSLRSKLPVMVSMGCQTSESNRHSGLLLMRHMESFMGNGLAKWTCGLEGEGKNQSKLIIRLRQMFIAKLITSDVNDAREDVEKEILSFSNQEKEVKKKMVDDVLKMLITG